VLTAAATGGVGSRVSAVKNHLGHEHRLA
jgi:hypothetical protein